MNSEQVKDIMKVALDLKKGESMSIEIPSKGQGLSLRTMFYKERLKVLQSGIAMNVSLSSIKQRDTDKQWVAIFTHEEPLKVTLHKADGSSSVVSLDTRIDSAEEVPDDMAEILERHRKRLEKEDEIQ